MAQRSEIVRWSVSCAIVLVCYAAAATAILAWEPHYEIPSAPETIAMIDLAPLPPEPTPPAPPPPPEPEIIPEPPPEVKVEVPLPPIKKPPPPKVKREEPPPEPMLTPSPPVETAAVAPPTPRVAARPDPSPNIMAMYNARITAHVQKNLRYPLASMRRNERGTAYVMFTLSRSGKVLSYKLENGTNRPLLDEEAIAVILRSDPMPAFPPEIDSTELLFLIPLAFTLR